MTILFIVFTLLLVAGFLGVPQSLSQKHTGFMSREVTSFVNGYFISIVFLSHLRNYIPDGAYGPYDEGFLWVISQLGQLVVTTFLFYSGYGIAESIKRKPGYIASFPRRRILSFLLDVWLAVGIYLVLMLAQGTVPSVQRVLLSMIGWLNLGNSNWYIFAILWMYVSTYIGFRFFNKGLNLGGICFVLASSVLYVLFTKHMGVGRWYYNTIACYPAGMLFSYAYDQVHWLFFESRLRHLVYVLSLGMLLPLFLYLHGLHSSRVSIFSLMSIVFVLLIILICMKVRYVGKPYVWVGQNLFCFYIYQRLPMIILKPLAEQSVMVFSFASLAGALTVCSLMTVVHKRYRKLVMKG